MKIVELQLKNYRALKDATFKFNSGVNAFIGPNGCGKSTTLNFLSSVFTGKYIKNVDKKFEFKLILATNKAGTINKEELKILLKKNKNLRFEISLNKITIAYKNIDGKKSVTVLKKLHPILQVLFKKQDLVHVSDDSLSETSIAHINLQDPKTLLGKLEKQVKEFGIFSAAYLGDNTIDKLLNTWKESLKLIKFKHNIKFDSQKGLKFGKEEFQFVDLSRGEKLLMVLMLYLTSYPMKKGVLIIDEPETSLHASWQVNLIKFLKNLTSGTQIIMATHSPLIINQLEDKEVISMHNSGHTQVSGYNLEETLTNLFDCVIPITNLRSDLIELQKQLLLEPDERDEEIVIRTTKNLERVDPNSALGLDVYFLMTQLIKIDETAETSPNDL